MLNLTNIEELHVMLKTSNQKFMGSIKEIDENSLRSLVLQIFESKHLLNNYSDLLLQWNKFSINSATYLNLPLNSLVYRHIKAINAYISSQPFFPGTACEACQDVLQPIMLQLNTPHNAFTSQLAPYLKALACASKRWNYYVNELQIPHMIRHQNLKDQESLLLDAHCKTIEEAINFAVEHKLEVANLKDFNDLTNELLEKLFQGCPNLKHLTITSKSLIKLPEQCSQLETLNCSQCNKLADLPPMPNLKDLNCSNCYKLASLPDMPKLISLDCSGCTQLSSLPNMPRLINLVCIKCYNLIFLPPMPKLKSLNCSVCTQLLRLFDMPSLIKLKCNKCHELTHIHDMPKLINLSCSICPQLIHLSNLPNLTRLNCSQCYELGSLSGMSKLTSLDCSQCYALASLPDMPYLISLDCNNCDELAFLPNIPKLKSLNYHQCKKLVIQKGAHITAATLHLLEKL